MFQRLKSLFSPIQRQYIVIGLVLAFVVSFGLYLNSATAATVNLVPSSTVSNAWPGGTAGCITNATGHTCVDEGVTANTTDYIGTGTGVQAVTANFEMGNQAGVGTATSLTLHMYARSLSLLGNAPNADTITMNLNVGGSAAGAASVRTMTTAFAWYSVTFNGNWTQAQVDNMQASFVRTVVGGGNQNNADDNVQISSVYVEMTYTAPQVITQAAYRWLADDGGSGRLGTLDSRRAYATSSTPYGVTTGDFNGDQITDLATANTGSSSASILIGNGDGTFNPKVDYATGLSPYGVTTGDFNGDQITDLATANSNSNSTSILIGNGDGTFSPKVDYATGVNPRDVTVGDFNGDQITDLATAHYTSNFASILIGNGDGTFSPKVDYATGDMSLRLTTGDFNGDQITDLATANSNSNSTSILIGNGDGTFSPKVDYATGVNPYDVTTGDFNGDQITDLATANFASDSASILIGNGDGTFDPKVDYATGDSPASLTTGDFNSDQITDLATANYASDSASILIGNGDGTFDPKVDYATGDSPIGLTKGDFNSDQITELVMANQMANTVSVLMGEVEPPVTALAAKDTATSAPSPGVGFRLRLNLAITGDALAVSTPFKLRYQQKSGACSHNPATYLDVDTSSPIRFFDKPSVPSPDSYSASVLDPTRSGITAVSQSYNESNPFTAVASTAVDQDALWDFSLTTADGLTPLTTYCVIATKPDNTALNAYTVIPEITISDPTLEQSNYRFYQNANSLTPGAPLAAENTKATIPVNSAFRLRQLLRQTNATSSVGTPFKLQAAEKITTCSAGSYSTLSAVASSGGQASTGFQQTAASILGDSGIAGVWSVPGNAKTEDSQGASFWFSGRPITSTNIIASQFGFSVPASATITGIEYKYKALLSTDVGEYDVNLVKNGSGAVGTDAASLFEIVDNTAYTKGSPSSLWGTTWTPAEINNAGFGVKFVASVWAEGINTPAIEIDYMSLNVHYLAPATIASFTDNLGLADNAAIGATTNDPSPTSGSVIPQTYNENEAFVVGSTIQNGENAMWDFALRADESLVGKTYCFRVVKDSGALLANYAQYPEVTFAASGPTLSQQLRGGQSVVNGLKRPFNW